MSVAFAICSLFSSVSASHSFAATRRNGEIPSMDCNADFSVAAHVLQLSLMATCFLLSVLQLQVVRYWVVFLDSSQQILPQALVTCFGDFP